LTRGGFDHQGIVYCRDQRHWRRRPRKLAQAISYGSQFNKLGAAYRTRVEMRLKRSAQR
jgi:hypothetical protein